MTNREWKPGAMMFDYSLLLLSEHIHMVANGSSEMNESDLREAVNELKLRIDNWNNSKSDFDNAVLSLVQQAYLEGIKIIAEQEYFKNQISSKTISEQNLKSL